MTTQYLLHSPADVVNSLLVQLGLGTASVPGGGLWPVFTGNEPTSPDDAITVYDTQGTDDGREMRQGVLMQHWGFQVRVRSINHKSGHQQADMIRATLADRASTTGVNVTLDTSTYLVRCVTNIKQVVYIGKDTPTSKRSVFTLNATCIIDQLS